MENFQKIEQLVNKAGCSYEDAKAALEGCGWDMIDAIISLERDGKVKKETAEHTSPKIEETIEIVPEVTSYKSTTGDKDDTGRNDSAKAKPKREFKLWNRIKRMLMNNRMVVLSRNDQQILDLPIVFPVIALIVFFWATLAVAVLAMIFGCRFHFEGEDLGKTNINSTMDKATDYAEKVKNDLSRKVNDEQNTDN
ncbi:MAG: DUF4342 domain-containing protein [Mogibacterium sp.]|nr:DUF4342 domain-containing protein [Mogibacterium sp.]